MNSAELLGQPYLANPEFVCTKRLRNGVVDNIESVRWGMTMIPVGVVEATRWN
jgi:hypothetical protein